MEVRCHTCGNSQELDEKAFGNRDSLQVECAACGKTFRVISPKTLTLKVETTRRSVAPIASYYMEDGRQLSLPKDKVLSLKLVEGGEKGTVFAVAKPRITLGRANADITIDDPLVSRLHCVLETMEEWVQLRDLGSTNGTLVNDELIAAATLENGSKFQIGKHVFQLVISPKEK